MNHLFNVSCRLPTPDHISHRKQSATELGATIECDGISYGVQRIGWTGQSAPEYNQRDALARKLLTEHAQLPVFLEEQEINEFYYGFCNTSLWPLLHYISSYAEYDQCWYATYRIVNERFADKVLEHYRTGDLVWVHDYHLMLVPQFIKEKCPDAKVGFFLHTPFPSYELFRCHPNRTELLTGMLHADMMGFQTFGYLRHFRSTVLRLLGVESEINEIPHEGRVTETGVYPVGVKYSLIQSIKKAPEYRKAMKDYRSYFKGKQVVLSADRLDYSQGILKKLTAIETFLRDNPEACDNVVFILLTAPPGEKAAEFEHLTHDIEHAVGRINGRFSTMHNIPLHFMNKWIPFSELCALYTLSDVALVTPLMDGMNIIAKEYVACKQDKNSGVLVLSEFAGASEELFNAIMVNPYNNDQMAAAIQQGLCMPEEEKARRLTSMLQRIETYDFSYWANSFVKDLAEAAKTEPDATRALNRETIARFRDRNISKALFLDYDGSLREFVDDPEDAVPSDELLQIFEEFDQRDDLDVYIVSGRDPDFMQKHFGRFHFTLVGEHGFFVRRPGGEWDKMIGEIDLSWKEKIMEIFKMYSLSTPSTSVEEKHSAIVWHYRQADPEFGAWKAAGLLGDLTEAISNLPVAIHQGQKIIEVSSQHVSKGLAVAKFMNEKHYDLVLCAGDDKTDETMLYFDDESVITVKIGNKDTDANFRTPTPRSFRKFLHAINQPKGDA